MHQFSVYLYPVSESRSGVFKLSEIHGDSQPDLPPAHDESLRVWS